ncbi:thioredoxin-like domain-containing protein [uncultured Flavobacterium sp.]|uniref:TlpA family protein disulfide reductase n=1 Tax=uncultured Flavobacterium sp. TaxID=165435 RepID=UPI0025E650D4|nr:thioredoxin-like domain-containing protein [uncultured Flavobacterium sp.]
MSHLTKAGLLLCFLFLISSCGKEEDYSAYFGGQVINPRTNYVIFSKDDRVIDTLRLDKDNRFSIKFDSLTPGLYSFKHDPDYQYVYLDKNDSIMVSMDSEDFDESIVFSGRGERKNNFMMELFLLHEDDRNKAYNIYGYDYPKFKKNIDSTYARRKDFYEKRKAEIKWGEDFDFYAKSRVDLNYYTKKEYYPYVHARRTGSDVRPKLPKDFYSFRKSINFNNTALIHYSPYLRYLSAMLNNMAIAKANKNGYLIETPYQSSSEKLEIADSVFADGDVKNQVLNNIAFSYLLEDQNIENNKKFLERYLKLSTDDSETNEIRKIGNAIQALKNGTQLPAVVLTDRNGKKFEPGSIKRQTVIFFWTGCAKAQLQDIYEKIKALKQTSPDVDFIAVNVDEDNEWKKILTQFDSANVLHLRATDFHELRNKWVITNINRTIILNPGGLIKDAFASLQHPKFAEGLK